MIIFDAPESVEMFDHALKTFENLDGVIDNLYAKTENYRKTYLQ